MKLKMSTYSTSTRFSIRVRHLIFIVFLFIIICVLSFRVLVLLASQLQIRLIVIHDIIEGAFFKYFCFYQLSLSLFQKIFIFQTKLIRREAI